MTLFPFNLTQFHEGSIRDNPSIPCFSSLPAELRINIYQQTLKYITPILVSYDKVTMRFQIQTIVAEENRTPLKVLKLLSTLDHYIRQEARSFFFSNNSFQINVKQTLTTHLDYVQLYIKFLEVIGETGRRSLRHLRLTLTGDSKQHRPRLNTSHNFWKLLSDCMNLQNLDLFLHVDYFYMSQLRAMRSFLSNHGSPVRRPWPMVLETLKTMKNLKCLILHIVFSSRWHNIDVTLNTVATATSLRSPDAFKKIQFQVKRPIDEAAELTEQVKGFLRRGLRRQLAVRALAAETWDQHGADVTLKRVEEGSYALALRKADRFKPQERQFDYDNFIWR